MEQPFQQSHIQNTASYPKINNANASSKTNIFSNEPYQEKKEDFEIFKVPQFDSHNPLQQFNQTQSPNQLKPQLQLSHQSPVKQTSSQLSTMNNYNINIVQPVQPLNQNQQNIQYQNQKPQQKEQQSQQVYNNTQCEIHHSLQHEYYCVQCREAFCPKCFSYHQQDMAAQNTINKHLIYSLKELPAQIKVEVTALRGRIQSFLKGIGQGDSHEMVLPCYTDQMGEYVQKLHEAEAEVVKLVKSHFSLVEQTYHDLFGRVPCVSQFEQLQSRIGGLLTLLNSIDESIAKDRNSNFISESEANQYYQSDLSSVFEEISNQYNVLKTMTEQQKTNSANMVPSCRVDYSVMQGLLAKLENLATTVPHDNYNQLNSNQNKDAQIIQIQQPNYFLQEFSSILPFIDAVGQNLYLFDVETKGVQVFGIAIQAKQAAQNQNQTPQKMQQQSNINTNANANNNAQVQNAQTIQNSIPFEFSLIITPNLEIYFTGGVDAQGNISDNTFSISLLDQISQVDPNNQSFISKPNQSMYNNINTNININNTKQQIGKFLIAKCQQPMPDRKVAHGLVYVCNQIYCIGGMLNEGQRTNHCEKYDINNKVWTTIASMNIKRSRVSVSSFDDLYIFAFFGNISDNCSSEVIEKYNILKNEWTLIAVQNQYPTQKYTFQSSIQINSKQILIFGGFRDSIIYHNFYYIKITYLSNNISLQKQGEFNKKSRLSYNQGMLLYNVEQCALSALTGDKQLPLPYLEAYQPVIYKNTLYSASFVIKGVGDMFTKMQDIVYVQQVNSKGDSEVVDFLKMNQKLK